MASKACEHSAHLGETGSHRLGCQTRTEAQGIPYRLQGPYGQAEEGGSVGSKDPGLLLAKGLSVPPPISP